MKRFAVPALCVLFTLSLNFHCIADNPSVKLGALYNLTGGMAAIDAPSSRGSLLAAKLINKQGGVLNGSKLEVIVTDTKTDLKVVTQSAQKMISVPVVAGLGYGDSDMVLAAAPAFQQHGIPFLTTGATDPELPEKIGRFMFMTPFSDKDQAYAMADFAYDDLKARRVVLWTNESTVFTRTLATYFKERCLARGGAIVDEQLFKADRKDFSSFVQHIQKLSPQPEAIFVSGIPEDAVPTVEQLRKAGIMLPVLSGDGFDADLLSLLPDPKDAESVYFASHAYFGSKRPEVIAFVDAYKKEYGKPPENSYAALGFDAVNLLADAIQRAGSPDSKAVAKALSKTNHFKGVTGDISFTRPGRVPVVPVAVMGIKEQSYQLMTSWTPETSDASNE